MIPKSVKDLFKFINYLHSKTRYFVKKRPLIESVLELHIKRNLLKPNKNYKDRIEYNKLQILIEKAIDVAEKETTILILEKINQFKIATTLNPSLNLNAQGDLFELQRTFTDDDLKEIFEAKRKYLNFRQTTNCDYLLQMFFHDLDRDLKEFFEYFKDVEGNEFAQLDPKTAKAKGFDDLQGLLHTGKVITLSLNSDLTKLNIEYYTETSENIEKDFKTEYRKVQRMGNTSISLLRNFENDTPFTDAFQKEFAAAPLFADVSKYWGLFYTDDQMEAGFEEMDKMIIPKKSGGEMVMADFVSTTQFESHLNELKNEFYQLITHGKAPKSCYTHNIKETNIYKQFAAIEDKFKAFKEMKNFNPSTNSLLLQAEQFGQGIISEIEKIDYEPIREKIISTIINDAENIYIHLPKIVDSITNTTSDFSEKDFAANYSKAKMYLNNYLKKYLNISSAKKFDDQQTDSEKEQEQETSTFTNNFDKTKPTEIYKHFKAGLVEKGYLTEQELNDYLKAAFELKTIPKTLFKIKDAPTKQKLMKVFYEYYKNIAGKPHRKQYQYSALLGDYFEGFNTKNVSTNFNK